MEHHPTLSAKRIRMDGSFSEECTCPVCLGLFQDPVILKCGHTICSSCEKKLVLKNDGKKSCPKCRRRYAPQTDAAPNISVRNVLQRLPKEDSTFLVGVTCPHIGNFTDNGERCFHCEKTFCAVCMHPHLDRVQMEMRWLYGSFVPRLARAESSFETSANKAKKRISEKIEDARSKVKQQIANMNADLKRVESEYLSALNSCEDEETGCIDRFADQCHSLSAEVDALAEDLKENLGISLMLCSTEQLKKLNAYLILVDHKLYAMEKFPSSCEDFNCTVNFSKLKTLGTQDPYIRCRNSTILSTFPEKSTEQLRLAKAMTSLASAKDFYEMRLPFVPHSLLKIMVANGGEEGKTSLHEAVAKRNMDVVRYLVETWGVNVFQKDDTLNGDSPIHTAARLGAVEIFKYFVERDSDCLTYANNRNATAFDIATHTGRIQIAKFCVESQNINVLEDRDTNGHTPLMVAAMSNHVELVKYFVGAARADSYGSLSTSVDSNIARLSRLRKSTSALDYLVERFHGYCTKSGSRKRLFGTSGKK